MTAPTMSDRPDKPLMRSLGEFFGHIVKGIKTDPKTDAPDRAETKRTVEEEDRGNIVLRRTTIEEIEVREGSPPNAD